MMTLEEGSIMLNETLERHGIDTAGATSFGLEVDTGNTRRLAFVVVRRPDGQTRIPATPALRRWWRRNWAPYA